MDLHATADFAKTIRKINPWLHGSGFAPRLYPRAIHNDDDDIRALQLTATRTHDWALINNRHPFRRLPREVRVLGSPEDYTHIFMEMRAPKYDWRSSLMQDLTN